MKFIVLKIFEVDKIYTIKVQYIKYNEQKRTIDNEYISEVKDLQNFKYFLKNFTVNNEYKKATLIINYISNQVIIDNLNLDNRTSNNKVKALVNNIYPNFETTHTGSYQIYSLYNKRKYLLVRLFNKQNDSELHNQCEMINYKKKIFNYDQFYIDDFIAHHKYKLMYKHIIFIQVENNFWRFSEILNGKLVNYLILNEKNENFETDKNYIFKIIDRRIDEIIMDSDYRTFVSFSEEWSMYNIMYVDYAEKFRYFDEKKYVMAIK